MVAKLDERRHQKSWRKVHLKLLLLGGVLLYPRMWYVHIPAANWQEIWLPSQTPLEWAVEDSISSTALWQMKCFKPAGYMPASFVIASSCQQWCTACIQVSVAIHCLLMVKSGETKNSQSLNYLVVPNEAKGHPGVPTEKVNKIHHEKCTYCSCEQQGTQQRLLFEPPSPNSIKTNILVNIWRSHATCSWTRGKQTPKWKGMPISCWRWVSFQIQRTHCLGKGWRFAELVPLRLPPSQELNKVTSLSI